MHHFDTIAGVGVPVALILHVLDLTEGEAAGTNRLHVVPIRALRSGCSTSLIYLVALGSGGYQPNIATFGADHGTEPRVPVLEHHTGLLRGQRHPAPWILGLYRICFHSPGPLPRRDNPVGTRSLVLPSDCCCHKKWRVQMPTGEGGL